MNENTKRVREKDFNKWTKKDLCYSSMEVKELTDISLRTLRYRIKEVHELVGKIDNIFYQKNDDWVIHQSMVHHFLRKTKRKKVANVYQIDWKTFVTWIPEINYSKEYHSQIIRLIMDIFPNNLFLPVIETTEKGINHVHILSDLDERTLIKSVKKVMTNYWTFWECRIDVEPIRDKILSVNYILKDKMAFKTIYKRNRLLESVINKYQDEKFY